jgi:hypothetical protein
MFCKHLLVYINSKVPFHENLPPLPSHRSGVPGCSNCNEGQNWMSCAVTIHYYTDTYVRYMHM